MTRLLPAARTALFVAFSLASPFASAVTCYVNSAATGTNVGTSWANAFTDLQSALAIGGCSEIWIARGTYKPTAATNRAISFNINSGVVVYGGFNGTEATLDARFLLANPTVLSGDIGVAGDSSDNSYHVVVMDGTTGININPATLLSDVTISDGNANSGAFGANQDRGGGLFCKGSGATHECSPALENLIFENNNASNFGGAIYNAGGSGGKASPQMRNVILRDNSAAFGGGAMYNDGATAGGLSSPLIDSATFSGNSSTSGGAMVNGGAGGTANPTIRNSTFYANTATQTGGAIVNAGQNGGHASPVLRYVTFNQNRALAGPGGAIYNFGTGGDAAPNISGAIFWADQATAAPVEMFTNSATTPSIEYSITPECPPAAVGCINADPLLGPLQDNDGFAPTLRPDVGSPAIDNGNAVNCPAVDERGISRPQGAECDIGAVELRADERQRCYVNINALPPHDGLSWATAYVFLAQALADVGCSDVWVAQGTYLPSTVGRNGAFVVPPGKAVYGGFAGGETARSQRDPAAHVTTLSGDIGAAGDKSDNVYHVVVMDPLAAAANITGSTILDGFTITRGNANGSNLDQTGGGMVCNGENGFACNPTLTSLVFSANDAVNGGGLANLGKNGVSSPTLESVRFSGNNAANEGGALLNYAPNGVSNPVFVDCVFDSNTAQLGAGVFNYDASGSYSRVVFSGNHAYTKGGGLYNFDPDGPVNLQFTSTTFTGNLAQLNGGAVANDLHGSSLARFDHVTFEGNGLTAAAAGGAVANSGSAVFRDVLFVRNGGAAYRGGAIANAISEGGDGANLTIDGAAFVGNSAGIGGAVANFHTPDGPATIQISNATFWKNMTYNEGGAITNNFSSIVLRNVTFGANGASAGGALAVFADASHPANATISNAILWGDSANSNAEIYVAGAGATTTIDHSIVQNGCPAGATCSTLSSADPLLGLFQLYGGFTPALMPAANSPALNVAANCPATDQRGVARPQGVGCDIGAVERRATEDYLFNDGFDW